MCLNTALWSQVLNPYGPKSTLIPVLKDTVYIDTLSLIPGSVTVQNIDTNAYFIDYYNSYLVWKSLPDDDSVRINYRTFAIKLNNLYYHKDIRKLETNYMITPYYYNATDAAESNGSFVDFGAIDYSGSFGRVLSLGNNQDVVLNSQFNLQMEGYLGDSVRVTGAITDNNIPFQPEGNTQQIQEFDRLFIQLQRKKTTIIAGDYDIKRPNSYFMNFYKRVQGGLFSTAFKTGDTGENKITAGVSFAKGKFVRNTVAPLEGNQGPYKLTGPNGEQFFVVLAGTERVYIDGILMSRGENEDYVIDYNTAEITFMPRRLITKDWRIIVEFEFADRNYLNSLVYLQDEWTINNKLQLRWNVFSNQDARNQPIMQNLDSAQKRFLAGIGDSIQQALYPSARLDTFSNNKVLYRRTDTLLNGITYNDVYIYSMNPDSTLYSLSFTFLGQGKGNYRQSISSANGRVYEWVAPIDNQKQGDYEPIQLLVTPKRQQLITSAASYQLDSAKQLNAEVALSNSDPNTFSAIDNQTHQGIAAKINYSEFRKLRHDGSLSLSSSIQYEFVQDRFKPLERFRQVEFFRDWNTSIEDKPENEHLGSLQLQLQYKNHWKWLYRFDTYLRGKSYKGLQQTIGSSYQNNSSLIQLRASLLSQQANNYQSQFLRPSLDIEKQLKKLKSIRAGFKSFLDHNDMRNLNDSLLTTAFSFDQSSIYIRNNAESTNQLTAEYIIRRDRFAKNNQFKQATLGQTFSLSGNISSIKNQDIRLTTSYRTMQVNDSTLSNLKPEETLLGRVEYNYSFAKGLVSGNILYEMGAGQELKREFTYVQVPAGQGQYVWRDYNNDGLKQLNEFELAIFPDEKLYIRIFTPTNQYVKAKYSIFNQSIAINPRSIFNQSNLKGFKKALSILYFQSTMQSANRFIGQQGLAQYNPFIRVLDDTLLINSSATWVHSLFINRFSNIWGLDLISTNNKGKTLLNYGVDGRQTEEQQCRFRYNLRKNFTLQASYRRGNRRFISQFLENRSFFIQSQVLEPSLMWLLKNSQLRLQPSYKYDQRQNKQLYGGESAIIQNAVLDIKYNILSSGAINLRSTYSRIQYDGIANSTVGYAMLDGLQAGNNWLWGLQFERRVSRNIEMSIEYEGRKPAGTNIIHTGRASVRAIF